MDQIYYIVQKYCKRKYTYLYTQELKHKSISVLVLMLMQNPKKKCFGKCSVLRI